jgi:hypothetical protein
MKKLLIASCIANVLLISAFAAFYFYEREMTPSEKWYSNFRDESCNKERNDAAKWMAVRQSGEPLKRVIAEISKLPMNTNSELTDVSSKYSWIFSVYQLPVLESASDKNQAIENYAAAKYLSCFNVLN